MTDAKLCAVETYLTQAGWAPRAVRFLAAGEYNENYRFQSQGRDLVLRINHGSQLGLEHQIAYEFAVLQAVAGSEVTPRPLACAPHAPELEGGCLVMEYFEGRPLRYETDLEVAASIFSRIHAVPAEGRDDLLLTQVEPVADIAAESLGLLERYPDHPRARERQRLERYYQDIMKVYHSSKDLFDAENLVIVNTEVNSGNFIVGSDAAWLVDWEKAVISHRYQDLGHFLVPTTTLWKTDTVLEDADKDMFLRTYARYLAQHGAYCPVFEELREKTRILERTILLRALSWCYMAWYEYTQTDRGLRNEHTFAVIQRYLDEMECFLS